MAKEKKIKRRVPPPPADSATPEELAAYFEKYGMDELEAAGYVQELSREEETELAELSAQSRHRVANRKGVRTQLNLALSADQLQRFTSYANKKHIPPSTLAKAWILERLDQESTNK